MLYSYDLEKCKKEFYVTPGQTSLKLTKRGRTGSPLLLDSSLEGKKHSSAVSCVGSLAHTGSEFVGNKFVGLCSKQM
jgi:hypothetical protein